ADRDGLLKFAEESMPKSKNIFVAIGEPSAQRFLAQRIHDYLGAKAIVPTLGESYEISKSGAKRLSPQN
ncbi:MAG: MBL fold metallo-hydrolase RNA specificity domain-containing protein, partial [Patescibacteria group bacterium]